MKVICPPIKSSFILTPCETLQRILLIIIIRITTIILIIKLIQFRKDQQYPGNSVGPGWATLRCVWFVEVQNKLVDTTNGELYRSAP